MRKRIARVSNRPRVELWQQGVEEIREGDRETREIDWETREIGDWG